MRNLRAASLLECHDAAHLGSVERGSDYSLSQHTYQIFQSVLIHFLRYEVLGHKLLLSTL